MFSTTKNITFRKLIASTILVAFTTLSASAINNVKLKDSVQKSNFGYVISDFALTIEPQDFIIIMKRLSCILTKEVFL